MTANYEWTDDEVRELKERVARIERLVIGSRPMHVGDDEQITVQPVSVNCTSCWRAYRALDVSAGLPLEAAVIAACQEARDKRGWQFDEAKPVLTCPVCVNNPPKPGAYRKGDDARAIMDAAMHAEPKEIVGEIETGHGLDEKPKE